MANLPPGQHFCTPSPYRIYVPIASILALIHPFGAIPSASPSPQTTRSNILLYARRAMSPLKTQLRSDTTTVLPSEMDPDGQPKSLSDCEAATVVRVCDP